MNEKKKTERDEVATELLDDIDNDGAVLSFDSSGKLLRDTSPGADTRLFDVPSLDDDELEP